MTQVLPTTPDELRDLIRAASSALAALQQQEAQEAADNKATIGAAVAKLDALLGPVGAPAGTDSIRAVLANGDAVIEANPGVAAVLLVHGMETLTRIVRDLAAVVGAQD